MNNSKEDPQLCSKEHDDNLKPQKRSHACDVCDRTFSSKSNLKNHQILHTELNKKVKMGLTELQAEHVRKFKEWRIHSESFITGNINMDIIYADQGFNPTQRHDPKTSKVWQQSFTREIRYHFVKRILQVMAPKNITSVFQDKSLDYIISFAIKVEVDAFESANSKEEYHQLLSEKIYEIHKERREYNQKRKEMQMQLQGGPGSGPVLNDNSSAASSTLMEQSEDFSNERGNFKKIVLARHKQLFQMREDIKKITMSVKEKEALDPEAQRKYERAKEECDQISKKIDKLGNRLNQLKKMLEEKGLFLTDNNPHLNRTPSELSKSVSDTDLIEERRKNTRREVAVQRRYNQLRAANSNRGLVEEDEGTFDLTPLDEALPSVSHSKRAPGMKRRTLKLQDIVMNSVKEKRLIRLATAELCSMDTAAPGQNS